MKKTTIFIMASLLGGAVGAIAGTLFGYWGFVTSLPLCLCIGAYSADRANAVN